MGVTSKTVSPFIVFGNPALGFNITGTDAHSSRRSITGISCFGPNEQFAPTASAPIPSSIATIASGDAPVISFPSSP